MFSRALSSGHFGGSGTISMLDAAGQREGATVFAYQVSDPQAYGVVEFDDQQIAVSIEQKPKTPLSNWAVSGLSLDDPQVVDIAANLKPSARGELEISEVNRVYLERQQLHIQKMGRGYAWLDTGHPTPCSTRPSSCGLLEKRQGFKICCPEEIAFHNPGGRPSNSAASPRDPATRRQLAELARIQRGLPPGPHLRQR
jgi:glucose-1-phosphate thymidylyltransferase